MIKLDLVDAIVQKTNITRTKAEEAVETVFKAMKTALGRGERIELRRFGVFNVKPRKTGIGRNPRTGQQVNIPPGKAVRFKPGKELQSLPAPAPKPQSPDCWPVPLVQAPSVLIGIAGLAIVESGRAPTPSAFDLYLPRHWLPKCGCSDNN